MHKILTCLEKSFQNKWIIAWLLLPFIKPATEFTGQFDTFFDLLKIINCMIILAAFLLLRRKPSKMLVLIGLLQAVFVLSTIICGGRLWWCSVQALSIVCLCSLLELSLSMDRRNALTGFCISLGVMAMATVATMFICYPNGLYVVEFEHNIENLWHIPEKNNYLWGFDNASIFKFIPALIIFLLNTDIQKLKSRVITFALILLTTAAFLYVGAITAAAGCLLIFAYYIILFRKGKTLSLLNYRNCILLVCIIAIILIGVNKNITILQQIAEKSDKVVSLNYRFLMWNNALKEFAANPLLGCGFEERLVTAAKLGMDHPHNVFLDILYRGGLVGAALYISMLFFAGQKLFKARKTVFGNIMAVGFLAFLASAQMDYYNDQYPTFLLFILAWHTDEFLFPKENRLDAGSLTCAKAGIMTFHNTVNYGAMLQTYALQKYINEAGVPCEVVDYRCDALEQVERPQKLLRQRTVKGVLKYFTCHKYQLSKWARFQAFQKANVRLSDTVYTKENIADAAVRYDALIAGSDQIWNTELIGGDDTYYLPFAGEACKKYSYAGSFGFSEWPEGLKDTALPKLSDFDTLLVREERAKQLIDEGLGEPRAQVVVDPTLLLSKADWAKFVGEKPEKEHILVYMIDFRPEVFEFIRDLAKRENCRIIYVHDAIRSQRGMVNSRDDSVEDFLSMIYHAKYVVTGSFHALCLSLVCEKQLFYTLNSRNNRNSRLENLINLAGLSRRRVVDGKCADTAPIDYSEVTPRLQAQIADSKTKLNQVLEQIKAL